MFVTKKALPLLQKLSPYLLAVLLFGVFLYLRFGNIQNLVIFDWDQEQFATQVRDLLVNHKPTLLGPRVTTDKGFYLGPYFTYLIAPFFVVTKLHPQALVYFMVTVTSLFYWLTFITLKKVFSVWTALFFLLLWSVNTLHITYDRIPWWPIMLPLGVVATWWQLYLISKKGTLWRYILFGVSLGLFMNMHFQFIFIVLFAAVCLLHIESERKTPYRFFIFGAIAFVVMFVPLFLFDLRHEFLNSKLFVDYFLHPEKLAEYDVYTWWPIMGKVFWPLTAVDPFLQKLFGIVLTAVIYITVATSMWILFLRSVGFKRSFYIASLFVWLLIIPIFTQYGRRPSEYYFMIFLPFAYVAVIDLLLRIKTEKYSWALVAMLFEWIIILAFWFYPSLPTTNVYGLAQKEAVVQHLQKITKDDKVYFVSFSGFPSMESGFKYLLTWYGVNSQDVPGAVHYEVHAPAIDGDYPIGAYGVRKINHSDDSSTQESGQ